MLEKKERIKYLYEEFKSRFGGKTNGQLYNIARQEFSLYLMFTDTLKEKKHLTKFAKEYFQFRNCVILTRNDLVSFKQSEQYKQDKLINKIRFNRELKKYYKLCNEICKFEVMFFEEMGFSLLKIENERCFEEKKMEKQNAVRYLN